MREITKDLINEIIETLERSKTHFVDDVYGKETIYTEPIGLALGSPYHNYTPEVLNFFKELLRNFSEYLSDKNLEREYDKKILRLYVVFFDSFDILRKAIKRDDKLLTEAVERNPYNIFLIKNPGEELKRKALELNYTIVFENAEPDDEFSFTAEEKLKVLGEHPELAYRFPYDIDPLFEVEAYKRLFSLSFKGDEKKMIDIIREYKPIEDGHRGYFCEIYTSFFKDVYKKLMLREEFMKKLFHLIDSYNYRENETKIINFFENLSNEEFSNLMNYVLIRHFCKKPYFNAQSEYGSGPLYY